MRTHVLGFMQDDSDITMEKTDIILDDTVLLV